MIDRTTKVSVIHQGAIALLSTGNRMNHAITPQEIAVAVRVSRDVWDAAQEAETLEPFDESRRLRAV